MVMFHSLVMSNLIYTFNLFQIYRNIEDNVNVFKLIQISELSLLDSSDIKWIIKRSFCSCPKHISKYLNLNSLFSDF